METDITDKRFEIANKMLKAVGKVTAQELSEAALICIQLAAMVEDHQRYIEHVSLKVKEGVLTHNQ